MVAKRWCDKIAEIMLRCGTCALYQFSSAFVFAHRQTLKKKEYVFIQYERHSMNFANTAPVLYHQSITFHPRFWPLKTLSSVKRCYEILGSTLIINKRVLHQPSPACRFACQNMLLNVESNMWWKKSQRFRCKSTFFLRSASVGLQRSGSVYNRRYSHKC